MIDLYTQMHLRFFLIIRAKKKIKLIIHYTLYPHSTFLGTIPFH
jgi:hypothetical protein